VDETPHPVEPRSFDLATREVTVELFFQFLDSPDGRRVLPAGRDEIKTRVTRYSRAKGQFPAVGVTWYEAALFCNWLSDLEHLQRCYLSYRDDNLYDYDYICDIRFEPGQNGYRMPTEAEWEYACRAGTITPWPFGRVPENAGEYAWFGGNTGTQNPTSIETWQPQQARPTGLKKPNDWGLFDMLGNAFEWTGDLSAPCGTRDDPREPVNKTKDRVHCGGAFDRDGIDLRSAYRDYFDPSESRVSSTNGIRPARSH
jgi:formylglycine-generating enzyme required for sulfatase activity